MRVFILGLDGATFTQLDPMMEAGILPNIKEICDSYVSGPSQTIMPPVTAPAWLSIATGLNPGKTGVFDYISRVSSESESMAPISSKYYEGKAIWNILNKNGLKTGIFNYPTLSPAPEVDGFVVGGIGSDKYRKLCYPESLADELHRICADYEVLLNLRSPKYRKDINLFFQDIGKVLENQALMLMHLVQNKEWDFFFAVFSITDWIQHVLWKDIDENHPLYDKVKSPSIKGKYFEIWRRVDEIIGELLNIFPDDINFFIVSDHGLGPLTSVFYPNPWLERKGWLRRKRGIGVRKFITEKLKSFSESFDNKYSNALVYRVKRKVLKIESAIDFIDLEKSLAYSPEHNTMYGCINLTAKGRKTADFKRKLIEEVRHLPDEFEGIKSVDIMLPEEIYKGPYVELSPDIFFSINDYQSTVEIAFDKKIFLESPSLIMRTGSHRLDGVFMARGNMFQKVKIKTSILDIAPTILAIYGIEIPNRMDGRVLTECIDASALKSMNIRIGKGKEISDDQQRLKEGDDLEEMKRMLKSLGYM